MYVSSSLNWGPFSGPQNCTAPSKKGPQKGPEFRELTMCVFRGAGFGRGDAFVTWRVGGLSKWLISRLIRTLNGVLIGAMILIISLKK